MSVVPLNVKFTVIYTVIIHYLTEGDNKIGRVQLSHNIGVIIELKVNHTNI